RSCRPSRRRGGAAVAIEATADEQAVAVRAARAVGLGVAGVDLIRSHRGPLVLEVNASPGLEGIEEATGINIAGKIVELAVKISQDAGWEDVGRGRRQRRGGKPGRRDLTSA